MATASLNIPVEIPNSMNLNLEELKRQLTDYARILISKTVDNAQQGRGFVHSMNFIRMYRLHVV